MKHKVMSSYEAVPGEEGGMLVPGALLIVGLSAVAVAAALLGGWIG